MSAAGSWGSDRFPALETVLRDRILAAHRLLRALAIEAAAFAAEFGSDPRGPDFQAAADRRRVGLTTCIKTIDLDPPVALTEPSGRLCRRDRYSAPAEVGVPRSGRLGRILLAGIHGLFRRA